jgi:hypothetical protein
MALRQCASEAHFAAARLAARPDQQ